MLTTANPQTTRERLHARRRELLAHYRNMLELAEEEQGREAELVDAATGQWDVRVLSSMSDADAHALDAVLTALQRLDAGCYGICVACERRIEPERLRILPEAVQCLGCAELAEKRAPRRARKTAAISGAR